MNRVCNNDCDDVHVHAFQWKIVIREVYNSNQSSRVALELGIIICVCTLLCRVEYVAAKYPAPDVTQVYQRQLTFNDYSHLPFLAQSLLLLS